MRLLYNHNVIIKAAPLMRKSVKPKQMALSKSKWSHGVCALLCTLVILCNGCYENWMIKRLHMPVFLISSFQNLGMKPKTWVQFAGP